MDNNSGALLYSLDDHIYIEVNDDYPFYIGRIVGFNRGENNVKEVKTLVYYRRHNLPECIHKAVINYNIRKGYQQSMSSGLDHIDAQNATTINHNAAHRQANAAAIADNDPEREEEILAQSFDDVYNVLRRQTNLSDEDRFIIAHRELVLYREIITLPNSHIRNKCLVHTFIPDTFDANPQMHSQFLYDSDAFFNNLVYDPKMKAVFKQRASPRIGENFQAIIPDLQTNDHEQCEIDEQLEEKAELIWMPNGLLTDGQIDDFSRMVISIGTFERVYRNSSNQYDQNIGRYIATRDATLVFAMEILQRNSYSLERALIDLTTTTLTMRLDDLETWSVAECLTFQEELEKHGKEFEAIHINSLPMKSMRQIIEHYYQYKRSEEGRRTVAMLKARKDAQVDLYNFCPITCTQRSIFTISCSTIKCMFCGSRRLGVWHPWTVNGIDFCICERCWLYWKKYGIHHERPNCIRTIKPVLVIQNSQTPQ